MKDKTLILNHYIGEIGMLKAKVPTVVNCILVTCLSKNKNMGNAYDIKWKNKIFHKK